MLCYYLEKKVIENVKETQIMENYNSVIIKKKDNGNLLREIQIISK